MKTRAIGLFSVGILLVTAGSFASSDAPFKTILYGTSYYLEYMPYERLVQDVRLMEQAGVTLVRVGESTWGVMEPEDGRFDFSWLERVLDRMGKSGIKVILGTPTYSIPAWLFKKHPEIQVKPLNQPRYGYGIRQMTDLTNPTYRFYAERIIRKLVGRFRGHPTVIGYQLDNETHPSGTSDKPVQRMFCDELKKKFKTAEALNRAWGLNYWGQNIRDFDELPPRDNILNPGYKLEWERFQQKVAADFLGWQAKIVNELKRPGQFISHDFAGIDLADAALPAAVKAKHAISAGGAPLHFFYNFSDKPQTFSYVFENGSELLAGRALAKGQKIILAPWDLAVVKAAPSAAR